MLGKFHTVLYNNFDCVLFCFVFNFVLWCMFSSLLRNQQAKTFPQSNRAPYSILEQWASAMPCCRPQQLWLVPSTPPNFLPRMGSTRAQHTQSRREPSRERPPSVCDRALRVICSPSSLMSCPSSDGRRTSELSLGRGCSRNVHFRSPLVLLLPLGLTEGTESDLALGVQCQAVCTSPRRSSVPNKDNQVWDERKEQEQGKEAE